MALIYYFFNAKKTGENYDRVYTASDITDYLDGIVGSGVFPKPSNCLQVYAGTGMQVKIRPGQGWIEGHKLINTSDLILPVEAADVTLNRVDRVVFRVDKVKRIMEIVVKKGTSSSSAVAPALVRNNDIIEYSLATVTINKQTAAITESMIRDTRLDSSVCGVVQGLIKQVETDTLYKQWNDAYDKQYKDYQKEFDTWFDAVKDKLSTSTLLREYRQTYTIPRMTTKVPIQIPQFLLETDILTVYVNGMRLLDSEFSKTQTEITLKKPIDVVGTEVEVVVYKSVDGQGAETIVEQVEQLSANVESLKGKTSLLKKNVSIPTSAWSKSGDFYAADISNSQINESCMVNVNFTLSSIEAAQEAGVQGTTSTKAGACTIYAKSIPSVALTCDYIIIRGEVLA